MLAGTLTDLIVGGGSFGLAGITGMLTKVISAGAARHQNLLDLLSRPQSEEDKKRAHDLAMRQLISRDTYDKRLYEDVAAARKMTSRFVGLTRRGLAWSTLFLLGVLGVVAIISIFKNVAAVSIPISNYHNILFGLVSWTSHTALTLSGFVWMPWFQMWFFMIGGFYFGREATK